jgi:hypothetical protein
VNHAVLHREGRPRDQDEYVWWSDIVEAPLAVGTREEIIEAMRECGRDPEEMAPSRFERADRTGCSAMWPSTDRPVYGFDDEGPIAEQRGVVPRALISEYARRRIADDPTAYDLLEPFDGDDPAAPDGP